MRSKEEIYKDFQKMLEKHSEYGLLIGLRIIAEALLDIRDEIVKSRRLIETIDIKGKL